MTLALFDFDGTISDRDSMRYFLRYYAGATKYYVGCIVLSPIILAYFTKLIDPKRSKEIMVKWFLGNRSADEVLAVAKEFGISVLDDSIRPGALKEIEAHKRAGARVVVVSASCELWLSAWCQKHGLELLATKLEVQDGSFTGKIDGGNCRDEEKVRRVKSLLNLDDYDRVEAYGDTAGDHAMLAIATEQHYKPFRN
jgi:phosphatidylglycerophosphatase C